MPIWNDAEEWHLQFASAVTSRPGFPAPVGRLRLIVTNLLTTSWVEAGRRPGFLCKSSIIKSDKAGVTSSDMEVGGSGCSVAKADKVPRMSVPWKGSRLVLNQYNTQP